MLKELLGGCAVIILFFVIVLAIAVFAEYSFHFMVVMIGLVILFKLGEWSIALYRKLT